MADIVGKLASQGLNLCRWWMMDVVGILVVNVTWRGKTYVGTLMDTTKHHWASPR